MAFIPVPDTYRVCMRGRLAGQLVCNVFHVKRDGDPSVAEMNLIATRFSNAWQSYLRAQQAQTYSLQAIEVRDMSVPSGLGIEFVAGLPLNGTNDPTGLPNNVALAAKLLTGYTGRSYRGRTFMAGLTNSNLDGQNSPTDSVRAALQAFIDNLIAELVGIGLELVIASFFNGGAPRTTGVTTPVIGASVNDTLDSQRRRLPERGA